VRRPEKNGRKAGRIPALTPHPVQMHRQLSGHPSAFTTLRTRTPIGTSRAALRAVKARDVIAYPGGKPSLAIPLQEETILRLAEFHGCGPFFVVVNAADHCGISHFWAFGGSIP
jgi:hypothetical protein